MSTRTAIGAGEPAQPASAVHELTGQEPLHLARFLAEAHHIQASGGLPATAPMRY